MITDSSTLLWYWATINFLEAANGGINLSFFQKIIVLKNIPWVEPWSIIPVRTGSSQYTGTELLENFPVTPSPGLKRVFCVLNK